MTHPSRLAQAQLMQRSHPELDLRIVLDPSPRSSPSPARTARAAWAAVAPDSTHHLVIQDDVILAPGFLEQLTVTLSARPSSAIALFNEWASASSSAVRQAAWRGNGMCRVYDPYVPSVALVLPAQLARAASHMDPTIPQDDVQLLQILGDQGCEVVATVPNLVQHGASTSLAGNAAQGARLSAVYAGLLPRPHETLAATEPAEFDRIPCFSRTFGRPYYLVRNGPVWRRASLTSVLREEMPMSEILEAARADTAATRAEAQWLRPDLLVCLWLIAFAHGVELRRHGEVQGLSVRGALGTPIGALALGTLGLGIFDQYLDVDDVLRSECWLTNLTRRALSFGARAG